MVAILVFRKLDLPLHLKCNSNSFTTKRSATNREHQGMETARHHIFIYHVILIGLGQELNLRNCLCNVILNFRPEKIKLVYHDSC